MFFWNFSMAPFLAESLFDWNRLGFRLDKEKILWD